MQLGEPDASGRRKPEPIPGSDSTSRRILSSRPSDSAPFPRRVLSQQARRCGRHQRRTGMRRRFQGLCRGRLRDGTCHRGRSSGVRTSRRGCRLRLPRGPESRAALRIQCLPRTLAEPFQRRFLSTSIRSRKSRGSNRISFPWKNAKPPSRSCSPPSEKKKCRRKESAVSSAAAPQRATAN